MIRTHRVLFWSAVVLIITTIGVGHSLALQFRHLGRLPYVFTPDHPVVSFAYDVSGDGSTVIGNATSEVSLDIDHMEAYRWTLTEGMIGLDDIDSSRYSYADAVSYDGSVVVGTYDFDDGQLQAYRWTRETGFVYLDDPLDPTYYGSRALDVSADGSVIVGYEVDHTGNNTRALRWTESGQSFSLLGDPDGNQSWATGVSADGSVIVGGVRDNSGGSQAFWWNESDGMTGLGGLAGYTHGGANAVSADGSTIVGYSTSATGPEAFRWTESGGMVGMGNLPGGGVRSSAYDVSADGSIIVGRSDSANGDEAFIWDAENGMRSIHDILENDYASDMGGWILIAATGISNDGSVISGYGFNPEGDYEAWMVDINAVPIPSNVWMMLTGVIGVGALRLKMIKKPTSRPIAKSKYRTEDRFS